MLQQNEPDDFVIATGVQYSVRQFIEMTLERLGVTIAWQGEGVNEIGTVASIVGDKAPALAISQKIVAIDPRYFRPTEVETLLGDPAKAKAKLGWEPEITIKEMIEEMVDVDFAAAKKHALLKAHGYEVALSRE